jgi:hypothetical protein
MEILGVLEDQLKPLNNVPNAKNFVTCFDFARMEENLSQLQEKVEVASGALVEGYKIHKDHVLHAKINRTEAEDLVNKKFDLTKGRNLENRVLDLKEQIKLLEHTLTTVEKSTSLANK